MDYYRVGSAPLDVSQIESMVIGKRYCYENNALIESDQGYLFCENEAFCSLEEPSLIIVNRRLHWAIPVNYMQSAPLNGRPYIHTLFDCFTALRDYYQATYGIALPSPEYKDNWWLSGKDYYMQYAEEAGFSLSSGELKTGDVLAFTIGSNVVNHTAVWLAPDQVYQHVGYSHSGVNSIHASFKRRLDSVWRHKDLM